MLTVQENIVYKHTYTNAFPQLNTDKFNFSYQKHITISASRELHSR